MPVARITLPAGILLGLFTGATDLRADPEAVAADEAALRAAGLASDGPALLEFFRQRTLSAADRARLADTVRRLGDVSFRLREKASADLVAAGHAALPFLRLALQDPDLEIARRAQDCVAVIEGGAEVTLAQAAARLLAARQPAGAAAVIVAYLPLASDEAVAEELLATLARVGVRDGQVDPAVAAALDDAAPVRRAAAAWAVGRSGGAEQRAAVHRLLADPDAGVRFRAAQGLLAGKEREAIPVLVALLGEGPLALARQAEDLLCRLAGDQAPAVALDAGADAQRDRCREAWAGWWRDHGARVDLRHLDLEQRLLGLTLIVAYDGFSGGGRVWEIGPTGQTRWEISNLQGPIDAHVLPGNRLLVAEHGARRVTERDFKGQVLWEHAVGNNPVSCQRLANGNTLITTYKEVLEVTRDGKRLFSYTSPAHSLYGAQKLRNGHFVCLTMNNGLLIELDDKGQEVKRFHVGPASGWATIEVLPQGTLLIPQQTTGKVVEFDANGKAVAEWPVPLPNAAVRLPNGNLLACSNNDRHVREVSRTGKVVWEQRVEGRPFRVRRR